MAVDYLKRLGQQSRGQEIGNKAASLWQLRKLGLRVPKTFVLAGDAYRGYLQDDMAVISAVIRELARKLDPGKSYAVRSSANLEDSFDHSFAGQFKTVLNVPGGDPLMQAVWSIWATTTTPTVQEYMKRRGIAREQLCMAVIIQEMITPVVSGVAFSRNPITGAHETVIEAVEGEGSRLVQEGVTPLRWTFRAGGVVTRPAASPIPEAVITEVAQTTAQLARKLKNALDLEWVYDGQAVYWLQMRSITSLRGVSVYSNRISRELMGGLVKPLIWSINIPMVNGAWIRILTYSDASLEED
jgi:phosphoenolpyruvate synthase/pyruvate phosphate dikinase